MRSLRYLSLSLLVLSPSLLAAKGCHFGADDVSLGTDHPEEPSGFGPGGEGSDGSGGKGSSGSGASGGIAGGTAGNGVGPGGNGDGPGGSGAATSGGSSSGGSGDGGTGALPHAGQGGGSASGGSAAGGQGANGGDGANGGSGASGGNGASGGGATAGSGGSDAGGSSGLPSYLVCGLAIARGACANEPEQRFGFNPATMKCEAFDYFCDGNENNFSTLDECVAACATYSRGPRPIGEAVPMTEESEPAACFVPPRNICGDSDLKYFFDPRTRTCEPFSGGGCGASDNVFLTRAECSDACDPPLGDATGVVWRTSGCRGFGVQMSDSASATDFTLEGTRLRGEGYYGCGCPTRAQLVMTYTAEPGEPVTLRLCSDFFASICQEACSVEFEWDLAPAFEAAGTTEFVFAD